MNKAPFPVYHSAMSAGDRQRERQQQRQRQADRLLADVLRATESQRLANRVWLTWPLAKTVLSAIAWFLTDRIVHPSGYSLLSLCVVKAFRRYEQRLEQLGSNEDIRVLVAFLTGAFEALPALVEVQVRDGIHDWDPLQGQPLGEWLEVHPNAQFDLVEPQGEAADRNPEALRLLWLGQLLPADDLGAISSHLAHICSGNVAEH